MNQKEKARRDRLIPVVDGIPTPRYVRIYDNDGTKHESLDRYTIVFTGKQGDGWNITANDAPTHPQGICQHGQNIQPMARHGRPIDRPRSGHLGRRIKFSALPEALRDIVVKDYLELWGIKP